MHADVSGRARDRGSAGTGTKDGAPFYSWEGRGNGYWTVKWLNDAKGYGFISPDDEGEDVELPPRSQAVLIGLVLGMAADLMFRMLGTIWDPSTGHLGLPVTTLLLTLSVVVLWASRLSIPRPTFVRPPPTSLRLRAGRIFLGTGFGGILFLFLSFLLYPNVVARWTGSSFELALALGALALFLYVLASQYESARAAMGRPLSIIIADVLILLGVADLALLHLPLAGLTASGAVQLGRRSG